MPRSAGCPGRDAAAYLPAQVAGGVLGAVLANLMFGLRAISISTHHRSSGGLWLSEALATFVYWRRRAPARRPWPVSGRRW